MAAIAQLGERQTEDLKVPGSIPGLGKGFGLGREEEIARVRGVPLGAQTSGRQSPGAVVFCVALRAAVFLG